MSEHIAIITVAYKNYTVLEDFLKSLEAQTNRNFHLFIADASPEKQPITTNLPHTIIPIENLGYAHGVNVGLQKAIEMGISRFCVINDDTYFEKDFVQHVAQSLESHPGSLIGGKIYYAPGYEYHKDRYSPKDLGRVMWYAGGKSDWNHVVTPHIGVDEVDAGQFNTTDKTEFITGCLMCFDKKVVDTIGLWDTSYFLYYEDADYGERAKRKNIELYFDPSLVIWHKNAQSTDGAGSKIHENYQRDSRYRFALKYAPFRTKIHVIKNHFFTVET